MRILRNNSLTIALLTAIIDIQLIQFQDSRPMEVNILTERRVPAVKPCAHSRG